VNYIEGVLGGGFSCLDLNKPEDRQFLLGALSSAAARGILN
jgi:hypothetical protein